MSLKDAIGIFGTIQDNETIAKVLEDAQSVKITSYKDIPEIKRLLETDFIKNMYKAFPKECYKNAAEFASYTYNEIEYVEGLVNCHGLPIAHAWNSYKGQHFDLTFEMNDRLRIDEEYMSFFSLKKQDLYIYMKELGYYGAFGVYHYTKNKLPYPILGI